MVYGSNLLIYFLYNIKKRKSAFFINKTYQRLKQSYWIIEQSHQQRQTTIFGCM